MNSLRRRIDRFCVLHPNFGIPNLMLYIVIGNIAFYLLSLFSTLDGGSFYSILSFSWAGAQAGAALAAAVLQLFADGHATLLAAGELLFLLLDRLDARARVGYGEVHHLLHSAACCSRALGAVITSLITGYDWQVAGATYVNFAMFFAFATLYPDAQVLLFFFIPVKIKWMAILDACYFAYIIFFCAVSRYWIGVVLPLVALLNFFVFFAPELGRFAKREQTRTKQAAHFHNAVRPDAARAAKPGLPPQVRGLRPHRRHESGAAVRYCSKCAGYHCFCSDHIFNHVHFTDRIPKEALLWH